MSRAGYAFPCSCARRCLGCTAAWRLASVAPARDMIASVVKQRAERVPASDAFFLHVETPAAPQHVGGLIMLDTTGAATPPTRERAIESITKHLPELPRFRQRLTPPSGWRRRRWVEHGHLDWDWHVPEIDLTRPGGSPGGMSALHALVAELAGQQLPRDRPLGRY